MGIMTRQQGKAARHPAVRANLASTQPARQISAHAAKGRSSTCQSCKKSVCHGLALHSYVSLAAMQGVSQVRHYLARDIGLDGLSTLCQEDVLGRQAASASGCQCNLHRMSIN